MKKISIILVIIYDQIFMVIGQIPQPRVYGGYIAAERHFKFPYQISLQQDGLHICGGAILTKSFVLTAAHCVTDSFGKLESPSDFIIMAGSTNIEKGGFHFLPRKFIVHEKYVGFKNDIALIQLKKPFRWQESIQPISVYGKELQPNDVITITGWGYTDNAEIISDELKFHYFVVSSNEYCEKVNSFRYYEGLLCLSHAVHNGACSGDSGGPAIFEDKLVGIANYIIHACGSKRPDVYANISYFNGWINKQIY